MNMYTHYNNEHVFTYQNYHQCPMNVVVAEVDDVDLPEKFNLCQPDVHGIMFKAVVRQHAIQIIFLYSLVWYVPNTKAMLKPLICTSLVGYSQIFINLPEI